LSALVGGFASGVAAASPDGQTLAYEVLDSCSVYTPACVNTAFLSLSTGLRLPGYGLEMHNPTWMDATVVGQTAGGVAFTGPGRPEQTEWFGYGPSPLPHVDGSTDTVDAAAATAGGTKIALVTTPGADGGRFLMLLTAPGLGAPVTAACKLPLPAGPDPHPVWSPDGGAIAWEDAAGVHTLDIVDLSGANCGANSRDRTIAAAGSRPTWSGAPYAPPATSTAETPAPEFRLRRTRLRRALRSGLRMTIKCPAGCDARATARRAGRVVARGRAHGSGPLSLRFTARARRALRHARRVRLTVVIDFRDPSGATWHGRRTVTLR